MCVHKQSEVNMGYKATSNNNNTLGNFHFYNLHSVGVALEGKILHNDLYI